MRQKCVKMGLVLPSDTKLLLTKNYSKIIIFTKITNFTRNSLKMSFFPGNLKSSKSLKITKNISQGMIFVIISCQTARKVTDDLGFNM